MKIFLQKFVVYLKEKHILIPERFDPYDSGY